MIPDFDVNPPEERGERDRCECCSECYPVEELTKDGLCYPCHDAELERRAMEEEEERYEDAYWRHINNQIDAARGK